MARTMFEKYGGFGAVSKVVSAFYDKVLDSDILGPYFDDVDMRRLVDHQTKFISDTMGGPASYSNEALRKVHASHHIDRAAYEEMARLLRETLLEFELEPIDVDAIMSEIEARSIYVISGQAK